MRISHEWISRKRFCVFCKLIVFPILNEFKFFLFISLQNWILLWTHFCFIIEICISSSAIQTLMYTLHTSFKHFKSQLCLALKSIPRAIECIQQADCCMVQLCNECGCIEKLLLLLFCMEMCLGTYAVYYCNLNCHELHFKFDMKPMSLNRCCVTWWKGEQFIHFCSVKKLTPFCGCVFLGFDD